jgi:hypothetical protein
MEVVPDDNWVLKTVHAPSDLLVQEETGPPLFPQ